MKRLLTKAVDYFDRINDFLAVLAGTGVVALMLLITVEVIMRYFFRSPIQGASEAPQIIMIVICFLGTA